MANEMKGWFTFRHLVCTFILEQFVPEDVDLHDMSIILIYYISL